MNTVAYRSLSTALSTVIKLRLLASRADEALPGIALTPSRLLRLPLAAAVAVLAMQVAGSCKGGDATAPPRPTSLVAASPTSLQATAGSAVSEKPAVLVQDQDGEPMANVPVIFAVTSGGGSVTGASQTTGPNGVATVGEWVLGTGAGSNVLTATSGSLDPVTFSATGVAGPASAIAKAGDNQNATAGELVPTAPTVTVTDANGNPVAGIVVNFAITSGGGSLGSASATTNSSGVATIDRWTMGTTAGTNTVTATAGTLPPVTFTAIGLPGAPAQLVIVTQPAGAMNEAPLETQPVVQIRDRYGNLVTTATSSVTASIVSGAGTIGGTVTVHAVGGIATFTDLALGGIQSNGEAVLRFTASGLTPATSNSFGTVTASLNLTIDGLYITQSAQNYQGTVPLVAGREALIRVFVKANETNTVAPAVRVRLYRQDGLAHTYTIPAPTGSVPTEIKQASLGSSWNVRIPANVLQSGLFIMADVDPTGSVRESSKADNSFPGSAVPKALDVRAPLRFDVTLVPVVVAGFDLTPDVNETNKHSYMEFAARVYPLSGYDVAVRAPYTHTPPAGRLDRSAIVEDMYVLHRAEGATRYYYGVTHRETGLGGTAWRGLPAAIGNDDPRSVEPRTTVRAIMAAHEWGHNFDRDHINCGSPDGFDRNYPHPPSSIGVHGYDLATGDVRGPDYADLMSYCSPQWISDYTYKAVLDSRAPEWYRATSAPAPQPSLLVWGRIGRNGIVLEPAFEINARPSLPTKRGPYRLRALDSQGRELFNFTFEATPFDDAGGEKGFAFVVPLSSTAKPASIRLTTRNGEATRRKLSRVVTPGDPTIAVTSPRLHTTGGRSRLEWDTSSYPMALIRDRKTGQILSLARGGKVEIARPASELDIVFSDGVSSVRAGVTTP
jgi:hypothetical protein